MSMYIVSWQIKQTIDNKPALVDHWQVSETWEHAQEMYNVIVSETDGVYCAAISQIVVGTEPHWYEDEQDYNDGQPTWEQEWEDFGEVYDDEPTNI
tara:strand:- start:507 stop:794 length:288 start_codon:yes stop_codon:yes gene_type:complete